MANQTLKWPQCKRVHSKKSNWSSLKKAMSITWLRLKPCTDHLSCRMSLTRFLWPYPRARFISVRLKLILIWNKWGRIVNLCSWTFMELMSGIFWLMRNKLSISIARKTWKIKYFNLEWLTFLLKSLNLEKIRFLLILLICTEEVVKVFIHLLILPINYSMFIRNLSLLLAIICFLSLISQIWELLGLSLQFIQKIGLWFQMNMKFQLLSVRKKSKIFLLNWIN